MEKVMNTLQLQGLQVGYESTLLTADFTTNSGIVAILGPSGSGKSTLLSTILGSQPPLSGSLFINGSDLTHTPIHQRSVGMVFQDPLLFAHLNVEENIMYGLLRHQVAKSQARDEANELLEWVGMAGYGKASVQELSGGQAQRVSLARALAPNPAVLLLDEPYSALDSDLRTRLASEVALLLRERNVVAIHVTHDEAEAHSITESVYRVTNYQLEEVTSENQR